MAKLTKVTPKNVHQILSKYILADGYPFVVDLKNSKGSYMLDAKTGKKYLDFFTFFASFPIGYNHPKMTTISFMEKLAQVAVNKPSNSDLYTVEMAEFVQAFANIAAPKEFKHFFFISGGGLAVENSLKAAFDWKVRLNKSKGIKGEVGTKVIHFKEAFHGRTGYTLSLTNTADPRKYMYFPRFKWPRITTPKITFPLNEKNLKAVKKLEERALKEINSAIKRYGNDIAALIIEPIQGEGGDNHFRPEFFKALRTITEKNNIIFIFDEVQSGMGLTGKWWAFQHCGITPDIVCFGKKSQVCGIMATDKLIKVKDNVFQECSRLNSTWGGNLVDMFRATKYLEIIQSENLVKNAEKMGALIMMHLDKLQKEFPAKISNVRGKGLMIAFDCKSPEQRHKLLGIMQKNLMIALPCGKKSVRFRPPLNISKSEVEKGMEILRKSLMAL
ncbi:MAG: L-lysine 6-transaminase [bacterium]|nr:L-lysine 6-transaminase [bacterium]